MIDKVIRLSVKARMFVLLIMAALLASGIWAVRTMPVDALPDLSDVQVIIRTSYPGQAPQIVENQVTYPLATTMLSVPGSRAVRGYSFNGDSYVYVLFDDSTDLYWARSRVLEYLNQVQADLPAGVVPTLGPDATGVGWIYEYALVDRTGRNDLSQLRSLQDWFLRYELQTIPGVAEVASIGGMVKQYQVVLDPDRMVSLGIDQDSVIKAIQNANMEVGGSIVEMAEREYIVRANGYLENLDDFRAIPLKTARGGVPVTLGDIARIQIGPEIRRGIAELNGEGEVAGGVIILRSGKNARETIAGVKEKLATLKQSLPPGVEIVTTYDRSELIDKAVDNLTTKLLEEFIVVAIVCALFLWHARSALVAILTLPLGILIAFLVMRFQGINANIMSLGGIAIAIGAMVDAAIVMIENAHKHLEKWQNDNPDAEMPGEKRWQLIVDAAVEVGPALFLSLLIITFSFLPIFTLEGQEGRLFSPLAFTKTYAMAGAAILSITLIPV
ncbi:MAG: efflux RND transporter permease subunit, partial [Sphingomonadales bacterium]|nr:efflux RND transporter permease subunit [Sphingomonadales bacterium]